MLFQVLADAGRLLLTERQLPELLATQSVWHLFFSCVE